MPVVSIIVETLSAFSDGKVVIIAPRGSYIKKIGPSFSCPDSLAVHTVHFLFVVVVRHNLKFWFWLICSQTKIKLFLNCQNLVDFFENSIKYRVFLKLIRPFTYLLMAIKGSVIALLFKQFNMCPLLNNLTILHDNDLIERNGLDDTMGDKNGSLAC